MKVSVKKIDALKREMKFEIPRERVSEKMEEVYREIGKVAKVKGYRPGKVPRDVLEVEHGVLAKEEMVKKLIPEIYQQGLEQEGLDPLDLPEILDVDLKDGVLFFKAHFDIKPEIKIKDYKGIKIRRKSSEVSEEEINKTLEYFRKAQGESVKEISDEFAKGLGYPSLEEFKKSLVTQMALDKDRQNRIDVENQIVEALLKEVRMTLPQTLVLKQLEHRLQELKKRMKSQGLPEEEFVKKEEEARKELKAAVEKDVKIYLVLDKIREIEKINVLERENMVGKVMEFLLKEAEWEEDHSKA